MTFTEFKEIVIAKAQAMGLTEYELYYQAAESTSVSAFKHEINQFTASTEGGVCFRCIVGGKMGYASTEELSEAQAISVVEKAADNATVLESEEQVFLGEGGKVYRTPEVKRYDLPATDALIDKVLGTMEQLYAADPCVVDGCSTQGFSETSSIAIVNTNARIFFIRLPPRLSGEIFSYYISFYLSAATLYQTEKTSGQHQLPTFLIFRF